MKNKRNQPCLCLFGLLCSGLLQNVTSVALTKITVPQATVGVQEKNAALLWQLALKHIYLGTVAHAAAQLHTQTQTDTHGQTHRVRESDLDSINKGIVLSPDICSKCLTQLNPLIDTSNVVGSASTLHPGSSPDGTHPSHSHSLRLNHFLCL